MNFTRVCNLDTKAAAAELARTAPLWDAFTARQSFPGSPHADTKCIPLRGASSFLDSYKPKAKRTRTHYAMMLPRTLALVNTALAGLPVVEVGNVLAVNLQGGGFITPHIDTGEYPDYFERFHIAVTSPEGNW